MSRNKLSDWEKSSETCHMTRKMFDISRDISTVWNRLFDHKSFLSGEINSFVQDFEEKRGDKEVDDLFKTVENITEIKDTEISRLKQVAEEELFDTNQAVQGALNLCSKFTEIENTYLKSDYLEKSSQKRKQDWDNFMDHITSSYSEINASTEKQEKELRKTFEELEKKLHL